MAKGTVKKFRLHDDVDFEFERSDAKRRNREFIRSMRHRRDAERSELEFNWKTTND